MADPIESLEALFAPTQYAGPQLDAYRVRKTGLATISRRKVHVPAGETRLLVLHETPLTATTDPKLVFVHSTVEQVEWWPIDDAAPLVDHNTKLFGYLLDPSIPTYEHSHGNRSASPINHHPSTNPKQFYDTLPCYLTCAEDIAAGGGAAAGGSPGGSLIAELVDGTESKRLYQGYAFKANGLIQDPTQGTYDGRVIALLLGLDNLWNLGTETDGLGFWFYASIDDITKLNTGQGGADQAHTYCLLPIFLTYPFSTTYRRIEDVPALNPLGVAPWAQNDPNLDRLCSTGAQDCGWSHEDVNLQVNATTQFYAALEDGDLPFANGYKTYWLPKTIFDTKSMDLANGFAGDPVWNRVTGMVWSIVSESTSGAKENPCNIIQVFFGPQPGLRRRLGPFEITTEQPWSVGHKPTIGIQNPTDRDAEVYVEYGGL